MLLKHLIGLMQPDSGQVLVDGIDLGRLRGKALDLVREKFGVLFQGGALFDSMTVFDNVAFPLREKTRLSEGEITQRSMQRLEAVGLADMAHKYPAELSGGMRKRAGIARAMALDPEILFLDEPSAGLDPVTSAGLDNLIVQLNASLGTTMVVVTHELPSIYSIAHRVIMLDKREKNIIAEGSPAELRDKSDNPFVRNFFNRQVGEGLSV